MAWIILKFGRGPGRLIRSGRKNMTSRMEKKGDPGDRFSYKGKTYELVHVAKVKAETILKNHYRSEGYDLPEELEAQLLNYYPDLKYTDKLWIHIFSEIPIKQTTLEA